ncbi:MAG: hypothetical protein Q8P12_04815, partial [bacterium]|nr:hypothetical protein [bacterium]
TLKLLEAFRKTYKNRWRWKFYNWDKYDLSTSLKELPSGAKVLILGDCWYTNYRVRSDFVLARVSECLKHSRNFLIYNEEQNSGLRAPFIPKLIEDQITMGAKIAYRVLSNNSDEKRILNYWNAAQAAWNASPIWFDEVRCALVGSEIGILMALAYGCMPIVSGFVDPTFKYVPEGDLLCRPGGPTRLKTVVSGIQDFPETAAEKVQSLRERVDFSVPSRQQHEVRFSLRLSNFLFSRFRL